MLEIDSTPITGITTGRSLPETTGDDWPSDTQPSLTWIGQRGWFRWLPLLLLAPLLIIIGRVAELQIVHGSEYRQQAEHNRLRVQILPAPRGSIVDRFGQVLTANIPNFTLTITPADLPTDPQERQTLLTKVSVLTNQTVDHVTTLITDKRHRRTDPVSIVDELGYDQALSWIVATSGWPGVDVTSVPTRQYPLGPAGAQVIGYVGKISDQELLKQPQASLIDLVGKAGLEKEYNVQLSGRDGQREIERNVLNEGQRTVIDHSAIPGSTLHLSLDAQLQQRLYDRVSEAVRLGHSSAGAAVAINPENGEILGLVSLPSYDDNWFAHSGHNQDITKALTDVHQPFLNRAIAGQYPSGSIIKPMLGAAALAEHIITPLTTVLSTGGLKVGPNTFPDWKPGGHGITNLTKAIAQSVNTFFYEIGGGYQNQPGLGVDRIVRYLQAFGWGQPTGIDLPGEQSGLLPTKEWRDTKRATPWRLGDTYHLAIGQGDLEVTPIQVAAAIAAVANGGTLYQPHLVTSVGSPDGLTTSTVSPTIVRSNIVPAADTQAVRQAMREGVLSGSSQAMQSVPVPVAGKTGTAQFGTGNHTHAWYTAFAPYDHPTIALAIVIEGGGQGHEIALPVAKDILTWYFSRQPSQL